MLLLLLLIPLCALCAHSAEHGLYDFWGIGFKEELNKSKVMFKVFNRQNVRYETIFDEKTATTRDIAKECVFAPNYFSDRPSKTLGPGERVFHAEFLYECTRTEDGSLHFEPTACTSYEPSDDGFVSGQTSIGAGDAVTMRNGRVRQECQVVGGRWRHVLENVRGCSHNGTVYRLGEQWEERNSKEGVRWLRMECQRAESGYFEAKVVGCAWQKIGQEIRYPNGTFDYFYFVDTIPEPKETYTVVKEHRAFEHVLENKFRFSDFTKVRWEPEETCIRADSGEWTWRNVTAQELTCQMDGKEYPSSVNTDDRFWTDAKRAASFVCSYGTIRKRGCHFPNHHLRIGETRQLSNGCTFVCHPQKNVYHCEKSLKW